MAKVILSSKYYTTEAMLFVIGLLRAGKTVANGAATYRMNHAKQRSVSTIFYLTPWCLFLSLDRL